jgi:peptidoglycan/xylan/chitin deacetylase (PgdA/CDA1 family)/glycosyltransferase involved in cell wall biosynthesis
MRVLFLTNAFPSPWVPSRGTYNLELARSLVSRHEVHVVAPILWTEEFRPAAPVADDIARARVETRDGLTIHYPRYYYTPKFGRRWYHILMWRSIRSTVHGKLGGFRPEAVVSYWAHPDGTVAVKYARQIGAAAFVMVGGSDVLVEAQISPSRRRVITDTLSAADGVFVVSDDLRERVIDLGVRPDCVHVVRRGVDRRRFYPGDKHAAREKLGLAAQTPVFLWVGRMAPVKGLEVLLEAAALLKQKSFPFLLVLAGDGQGRRRLEQAATDLGLGSAVRFAGSIRHEDLVDWYRAADATVLTSHSEGIPNVLLESHACGIPFIATAVGGVAEIAVPGVDRLAPPSNPAEFAAQMELALASPNVDRETLASQVSSLGDPALRITEVLDRAVKRIEPGRELQRGNPLRQMMRRALTTVLPRRSFLTSGPATSAQVCLTFDDGPHPEHTPALLDTLGQLGIRATFFLVGERAAAHPDIVRRIAAEGHEIGNHTWSHRHPQTLSTAEFVAEVRRTDVLLAELAGRPSALFRPPHGKLTAWQMCQAWRLGQTIVLWNLDPKDYARASADDLASYFQKQPPQGGDIVLMHDNHPHAALVLPRLVAEVKLRNLSFATPAEWLTGAPRTPLSPVS